VAGVFPTVVQNKVKKAHEITTRGTVKAAVLKGDPDCPNLVAVSVYDTKPVHFIFMFCENIEWTVKKRQVYNKATNKMEFIEFLRLNVNDDHNREMNDCNIQDQLRTFYRFNYWLRQRKW
jgi:hypothetical protein